MQAGEAEALARTRALLELGRHPEALAAASAALSSHPDSVPLLVAAGRAQIALGGRRHAREGLALLRRALAADPDDVEALTVLGVALMHTVRQGEEGERLLDRAVQLAPHDADVAYARALSLEHRSILRWDKAHEAVGRALELAPHDPRVRLLKAKVDLGRVGWLDDSGRAAVAEDLRGILAADPGNVEAAYLLARCEVKPDRVEVEDLHRVVRMDPLHGEAIAKVDAVLVGPVRQAYWVLWCLVALQAVLLRRGADWGAALKVLLFVFVLLVPLVRFRVLRRGSPPGFGRLGGRDPLLWLFAALVVVAAFVFKAGTDGIAPATSQWVCVALLLLGGAVYVARRVRRRRRYG